MSKEIYYKLVKEDSMQNQNIVQSKTLSDPEKLFVMKMMLSNTELSIKEMSSEFGIGRSTAKRYFMSLKNKNAISLNSNGVVTLKIKN